MQTHSMRVVPDPNAPGLYTSDLGARRLPGANDLNRYAVNLGQSGAQVKEYFDVSVYRNILDMLLTFEGVLNRWGQSLANETGCIDPTGSIKGGACYVAQSSDPFYSIGAQTKCLLTGAIGYAAGKIGPHNKREARMYADQQVQAAGLARGAPVGFFEVPDLLNLSRSINYEMNRVRLPVPHNFRQIANAIQGRDWRLCDKWHSQMNLPPKPSPSASKFTKRAYFDRLRVVFDQNYINNVELLTVYRDLKNAIRAMRDGTRREIDAANLASRVQEETIRREQEALIARRQAEEQARIRELEILAEKKAAYERELAEAARLAEEMKATRDALAAEQAALEASKAAATTQEEVIQIENQQTEIAQASIKVDEVEADKARQAGITEQASQNLTREIDEKKQELIQAGVVGPGAPAPDLQPGLPIPVLLTAAGLLLL